MHPLVRLGSTTFCLFWPLYLGRDSYFGNHCCGTIFRRVALSCTYSVCVLFVSLLSLCPLCFYLLQHPFSVHAQLRHAVTHHSAFFLQQRFNAFMLFHPLAFPAVSRKPLCALLLLFSLSFHFCLSTLIFVQPRNTWPTALPSFLFALQQLSLFQSCVFAVNCSARHL